QYVQAAGYIEHNPRLRDGIDALRDALAADAPPALLDCRTPGEHEVASIEAALLIPMNELPARVAELAELKDRPVVVHCHLGGRSLKVTQFLRGQGFTDVKSLAGGIDAWSRSIDPDVPRY
ncbi:MAG: rhodanese-like domain-containing protein, partial [Planctomycetota bacterium]